MLEEVLNNTKLWNANAIIGNFGRRISASNGLNPAWLDNKIKALSQYENISYDRLTHPEQKFSVPILRLKGRIPKKKVLLQAIHADEWAATEAIIRFVDDWGMNKVAKEIKNNYDITVIPLLSIDKFPKYYGSRNYHSDARFETIEPELDSAEMVIELHESSIKNQSKILTPFVYSLYGLSLINSYLIFASSERKKARDGAQSVMKEFKKLCSSDVEIMYSNDGELIEKITSELHELEVETNKSACSYSRRKTTADGKRTYGIELCSDWGEAGEPFLLFLTGMMTYPLTEISTYLNRTFRKEQIKQSRLQSAENGVKVIKSILTANL